ncbi:hypothetical protein IEN91_05295 [Bacillus velezensis]|uniref:hypothetical protein n=1 Tax=Bacillus velezensis TaxID=492670 RepID=UPI0018C6DB8F|nr:hypothetical protein [Bacillus velezensis]QPK89854.1 hypothetical protein IEN91_05295 [Bacillus velezensis]
MKFIGKNSMLQINGKSYSGNNITVVNNQVYIDGELVDDLNKEKKIEVTVLNNVDKIISDQSINIKGNITGTIEARLNINCGKVNGDVAAGNNVNCDDISGNATAGNNINCDEIGGNAVANKINK